MPATATGARGLPRPACPAANHRISPPATDASSPPASPPASIHPHVPTLPTETLPYYGPGYMPAVRISRCLSHTTAISSPPHATAATIDISATTRRIHGSDVGYEDQAYTVHSTDARGIVRRTSCSRVVVCTSNSACGGTRRDSTRNILIFRIRRRLFLLMTVG